MGTLALSFNYRYWTRLALGITSGWNSSQNPTTSPTSLPPTVSRVQFPSFAHHIISNSKNWIFVKCGSSPLSLDQIFSNSVFPIYFTWIRFYAISYSVDSSPNKQRKGRKDILRGLPTTWELTVSCSISLPDGGSFHLSLTVLLRTAAAE